MPATTLPTRLHRLAVGLAAATWLLALSGCTVITIAGVATSAAVGAVKLTGAAVGAAVDLVVPDGDDEKK